jgi:hypothetical protein
MMQSMSAEPKSDGKAVSHLARARVQHFPSADLFLRTQAEPGSESRSVSETREVRANFVISAYESHAELPSELRCRDVSRESGLRR